MNNQTLFSNYLMILKSTIEVYVHGTLESSNKHMKELLKEGLEETLYHQERTYNKMVECGWYNVSNIESSIICKTLEKIRETE